MDEFVRQKSPGKSHFQTAIGDGVQHADFTR
jgi:hypothetical protein